MFQFIPKYFLRGLLFVVPIALTIYIIVISIRWLDGLIPLDIPGLGVLIILGSTKNPQFLEQIVGRGMRSQQPKIIHFVDDLKIIKQIVKYVK